MDLFSGVFSDLNELAVAIEAGVFVTSLCRLLLTEISRGFDDVDADDMVDLLLGRLDVGSAGGNTPSSSGPSPSSST